MTRFRYERKLHDMRILVRIVRARSAEQVSWHYGQNILRNITCEQDAECAARIREPDAEQFSWHYGQNILRNITCEQDAECVARIREPAYSPNRMK